MIIRLGWGVVIMLCLFGSTDYCILHIIVYIVYCSVADIVYYSVADMNGDKRWPIQGQY